LNFDFNVNNWLNVGVHSQFSVRNENGVAADLSMLNKISPYSTQFNDDGTLNFYPGGYAGAINPVLNHYNQYRLSNTNSFFF
jgi:TonB-dependent starch-binding outer membrane protein SusC